MKTKVKFLVNESFDPSVNDLFAYFPELNYDLEGKYKTCYAHVGQHSACDPDYAKESRRASKQEYKELYNELINIGYDLLVI